MISPASPLRQHTRRILPTRAASTSGAAVPRGIRSMTVGERTRTRGGGAAIAASDPINPRSTLPNTPPSAGVSPDRMPPTIDDTKSANRNDAARLGNPSFVWRSGQERRLEMMARFIPLHGARVLDLGCGVGEYVRALTREGADTLGADVAKSRLTEARRRLAADPPLQRDGGPKLGTIAGLLAATGEALPVANGSLDAVILNEVIEHVDDDVATLCEVARTLRPGGTCVIFAPNRLYPFETHGIYLGQRYIFGNIPLVNWLPNVLRHRLVPHARAYRHSDWQRLASSVNLELVHHGYVYPGFDNVATRWPQVARILRAICYRAEHTPAARLGLSHLVVLRHPTDLDRPVVPTS